MPICEKCGRIHLFWQKCPVPSKDSDIQSLREHILAETDKAYMKAMQVEAEKAARYLKNSTPDPLAQFVTEFPKVEAIEPALRLYFYKSYGHCLADLRCGGQVIATLNQADLAEGDLQFEEG